VPTDLVLSLYDPPPQLEERFDAGFSDSMLLERPDYATVSDYLVRARRDEFGSAT
jgi:hypothetical protein